MSIQQIDSGDLSGFFAFCRAAASGPPGGASLKRYIGKNAADKCRRFETALIRSGLIQR
ncbi:hypothetical protein [Paraburkholderia saeva]|jgi:hypothetical protein|uniref:hypothetical protein n=1 Tax=Paraburkholderia saeva TaxID=2777537 RepID=UPI001E2C25E7|nr:hypothetical protein [Paraburkholderia saeva]